MARRLGCRNVLALDAKSALILIDLQDGIVGRATTPHAASAVVARAVQLASAFRARGALVILVRVSVAPDVADATPGRTDTPKWSGTLPEGWDRLVDDLAAHPGDLVVTKRSWGAFYGTELDLQLRRRGITQVVLAGIATSIGVESTARAAHQRGYHVTLATDAMSDMNADAHHNSIELIFPQLGERRSTTEIIDALAAPA
jgi:nicotinamidase-related amidase